MAKKPLYAWLMQVFVFVMYAHTVCLVLVWYHVLVTCSSATHTGYHANISNEAIPLVTIDK